MRKISATILMLSLLCGLVACGGGNSSNGGGELSLISCPEQGFTTKTDPSYTWVSDEVEGLTIYTEEKGTMPFVRISWFDDIDSVDDACDYMAETIRPALKKSNPDGMLASTESEEKKIGGKKLPAGEYTYEEQGQKVVMQLAFDTSGDHTVVYQAKYLYEKGEETLDALDKAIRNFKAGDKPKTDKANPDLLGGAGGVGGDDSGNGGGGLSLISCPELGFTTKADPSYTWRYVEGDGITIWTMSEDSIPFVLIYQTDILRKDSYRHLCEEYTPYMREEYGDDLLDVEEYEAYEIGGKKLPAALYTYKNSQGYTLQMLRLEDSTGEYTVQYTAKYQQGYGDDTLAALDTAIRNFRNTTGTSGGNTSKSPKTDSPNPGEGEFTIIPAETKTLEYETFDNGMISMEIPKGWKVNVTSSAGEYISYQFVVVNPEDGRYAISFTPALSFYSGDESKAEYCKQQYGITLLDLNPLTVENYYRILFEETIGAGFEVIENLGMTPAGDSGTVHGIMTSNGVSIEGLFSVDLDLVGRGSDTFGIYWPDWVIALGMSYITAPEGELVNWEGPLLHCLSTLTYSDAFIQGYNNQWQQVFDNTSIIMETGSEISDIITSGYEERQSTYVIISQKQSDATMGYERVYDTETGEIYKAYNGFTDDISTDHYLSERYQPVTDDMYLEGIDGYIER